MTQKEFKNAMAEKCGIKKREANEAIHYFLDTLVDCVMNGEKVYFNNFGNFTALTLKEKPARNIRTQEECIVPEHKIMKFKPSKKLTEKLNQ